MLRILDVKRTHSKVKTCICCETYENIDENIRLYDIAVGRTPKETGVPYTHKFCMCGQCADKLREMLWNPADKSIKTAVYIKTEMESIPKSCGDCKALHCKLPYIDGTETIPSKLLNSTRHERCPLCTM